MPSFSTPGGVSVTVNLPVGDLLVLASDRSETVVSTTGMNDPSQIRVSYQDRQLVIDGPQPRESWSSWLGFGESIRVRIDLPEGSTVKAVVLEGEVRGVGRLGACTFRTDGGEIVLDETGPLTVTTDSGDVSVRRVAGRAEVTSDSGVVQIEHVDGSVGITNQYGETEIGEVTGDLLLRGHDADLVVGHARRSVNAYTESGDIRIDKAEGETVNATSDSGSIEINIPEDVTATLDLDSRQGHVHNSPGLETGNSSTERITLSARSKSGDISIGRFRPSAGL
ncbi:DUF4097 domain-containing protein [Streptomyces griseorubiginosus]|uniref:DUF4097 family beta strand repeat-containing protein n=1 Tax=Streptomyces griseorubiginosus TaxID=67304 RepID=UPI003624F4FF